MDYVSVKFKREKNIGAVIFIPSDVVTLPRGIADSMSDFLDITGPAEASSSMTLAPRSLVSGAGNVASSRAALAADSGATLELANGVTYTLTDAVALPAGVVLMGPASGSATIAVTGAATINGGTSSVTVAAGSVYSAIPRATSAAAFVVKGS